MPLPSRLYSGVRVTNSPCYPNVRRLDGAIIPMVNRMMRNGIAVDVPYLHDFSAKLERLKQEEYSNIQYHIPSEALYAFVAATTREESNEASDAELTADLFAAAESINLNSPDQLAELLYTHMGLGSGVQIKKTKGGQRLSTGKKQLEAIKAEHPIIASILRYREYAKLKNTYADALPKLARWCPRTQTWRIHTQFVTTRTETGRLASRAPNLMNIPQRTDLGAELRAAFIASPGCVLLSRDYSQIELRILAHEANVPEMLAIFAEDGDIHDATTRSMYGLSLSQWDAMEKPLRKKMRTPVKNLQFGICVAAGTPVLTEKRGLVSIEKIHLCDRIWDGVEFVSHDGLLAKGRKKVITYDGLTATPDHKVWLRDGSTCTLQKAATGGQRLAVTEIEGNPIRFVKDHVRDIPAPLRRCESSAALLSYGNRQLCRLWEGAGHSSGQHTTRSYNQLHVREEVYRPTGVYPRRALHRDGATLQQSERRRISQVRRTWNQVPVSVSERVYRLCLSEFTSRDVQTNGYRSGEQQWELRTREYSPDKQSPEYAQHSTQSLDRLQREEDSMQRFVPSSAARLSKFQSSREDCHSTGQPEFHLGQHSEPQVPWALQVEVEVYDILNAGPRRRFTAGGKLVSNCYGLSDMGLQQGLMINDPPILWDKEKCQAFIDQWYGLYPGVQKYMQDIYMNARRYGMVWDLFGRTRLIPGIRSIHTWIQSAALREAGNMPIQSGAQGVLKLAMAEIEADTGPVFRDNGIHVEPLLQVHDELIWDVDENYADGVSEYFGSVMENVVQLKCPLRSSAETGIRWEK